MNTKMFLAVAVLALAVSSSASAQYGYSSDCEDARNDAESAASDLAGYARRLQQCAENEDFSDDCYTEFRRVKSAYDSYESTVSEVSSDCE
jgi:hypothetical protein